MYVEYSSRAFGRSQTMDWYDRNRNNFNDEARDRAKHIDYPVYFREYVSKISYTRRADSRVEHVGKSNLYNFLGNLPGLFDRPFLKSL